MSLRVQLPVPTDPAVAARVDRLEIPFNEFGFDKYGLDKAEIARFFTALGWLYRHYFRVQVFGIEHVPTRGRAMLVGNHSGGVALDAAMVMASCFFDLEPPRFCHAMAEYFINKLPIASQLASRLGQFTGLPEHAVRILEDDRLLLVFPEGARGTAKLYKERDSLVRFGTGFMRLALQTRSPIIPFAFVGGGEAIPTVVNLYKLGRALGVPYVPITPWLAPLPLPVSLQILYGAPMVFEGNGTEVDEVIQGYVDQVRDKIAGMIQRGRALRHGHLAAEDLRLQ
jgi:1-acyl-sn-glycerol-3-phosphate acyltransferase